MKGICCWIAAVLAFAATTYTFVPVDDPSKISDRTEIPARILAAGDPVAVITPLPDYVSNGSEYALNGTSSYDTDGGYILDWYWEITLGDEIVETSHFSIHMYLFKELGLYKITLTVADDQNQTNRSFTAVMSVLDKDADSLPDWWEFQTMGTMNELGSGDYDGDGYTNLEEYAQGTDPTIKDPQPNFADEMKSHWYVFVMAAAVIVGIVLSMWPFFRRRRERREKKKIEAAIAIERALQHEDFK